MLKKEAGQLVAALRILNAETINLMLEQMVDALQGSYPQPTEVVLHDLRRIPNTVRAIAGDITGRRPGDPPTDKLLRSVATGDLRHQIAYRSVLPDGRVLRSSTIMFTARDDEPAAALCINTDVTAWEHLRGALDGLIPADADGEAVSIPLRTSTPFVQTVLSDPVSEHFPHSVEELSARLIDAAIANVGVPVAEMRKEHKMEVVAELDQQGYFLVKQSAETAAAALDVTRYTVYNYLNAIHARASST
ncbi:helix-turn-helix transcriptional regulator [Mycobacterium shigaense]|uniref:Aminotransferase class V n=1 Tax=Mycobacterium shigaense TaxID=722731 RepID=A0A1Z4EPH1_9MYCO|nr:transcriptional regulator [Mycobacterium shigaense]BAX94848.1 aminotransferase class V [Mycobacterium shigaense]